MKARYTKIAAAVLTLGLSLSLAACEGQVPQVAAPTEDTATAPDLTERQEQKIRKEILDAIDQATEAKNSAGLEQRLTGPMLAIRNSDIAIAAKTGQLRKEATIPDKVAQVVIPTDAGWPRTAFAITTTTEDQQTQRLMVMTQESARQNYKLAAVARLFSGVTLPKFEVPEHGSKMGTPNDDGLVATPRQAVERYADVLTNGASSQFASQFADDTFRQTLGQVAQSVQEGMERNKGTQQQTFTAVPNQLWGMRSVDGSELVVAEIDSVWTRQAGEGRESQPASDEERALFGDGKPTSTMKVTYVNVVALVIPAKDSGKQITAVGADRLSVKVEAV